MLGFQEKTNVSVGEHSWLTVVSPDDPDGVELLLEPDAHPAPRLGELSKGDKHRRSLSFGDRQRRSHGAVPPAGCRSAITLHAKSPQPRWTSR